MKKSLMSILVMSCLVTLLTGCKNESNDKEVEKTTTTTTKAVEVNKELEKTETLESESSINYATYITSNKEVVVVATNNSGENKDIKLTAQFQDAHLNTVGSESDTIYSVLPGKEITVVIEDDHEWATVDVSLTTTESDKISYINEIKYTHKDTGKDIEIEVSNPIKDTIDVVDFSVSFFSKDGELVGVAHSSEISVESDAKGKVEIDYPRDERNKRIEFETYKVYLNEAYSNKK